LSLALQYIKKMPKTTLIKKSLPFKNKAIGLKSQPDFCNQIAYLRTTLSPFELLNALQHIEQQLGRFRKRKNGARTIDLDILLFNQLKITHPNLTIPHPSMLERDFIMIPLRKMMIITAPFQSPINDEDNAMRLSIKKSSRVLNKIVVSQSLILV
jgi:2-amino-4-hydroxy-6-hydroxymethyldihydropteridine diphosphokinase